MTKQKTRYLTQSEKFVIAYRDDFTCQYCLSKPGNDNLEIDHLIPLSLGGSDNQSNLITSCKKCNRGKSDSIVFPKNRIVYVNPKNANEFIHKVFGDWWIVVGDEYVGLYYWKHDYMIDMESAHDEDWFRHMNTKAWMDSDAHADFAEGLEYFRTMIKSTNEETL